MLPPTWTVCSDSLARVGKVFLLPKWPSGDLIHQYTLREKNLRNVKNLAQSIDTDLDADMHFSYLLLAQYFSKSLHFKGTWYTLTQGVSRSKQREKVAETEILKKWPNLRIEKSNFQSVNTSVSFTWQKSYLHLVHATNGDATHAHATTYLAVQSLENHWYDNPHETVMCLKPAIWASPSPMVELTSHLPKALSLSPCACSQVIGGSSICTTTHNPIWKTSQGIYVLKHRSDLSSLHSTPKHTQIVTWICFTKAT